MTSMSGRTFLVAALLALPLQGARGQSEALTLGDAVASALRTHPTLEVARAREESADAGLSAARAARFPGLALNANLTQFQEPMVVAPLHSFDPTNPPIFDRTLVQGRLGLQYTLFDAGQRGSRIDASGAQAEAARYGREATEMQILENVTAAYLGVLSSRAIRVAAGAQVEALRSELDRARQNVDAGTAAEVEALRAAATLQDALAQEAAAAANTGLAERTLARVMGVDPGGISGRPLADLTLTSREGASETRTSPLLAQADRTVLAAEARLGEQRAARLPRLEASAGLLDYGTATGEHVAEWQAGLQLSWPVFTGGARGAAVRRAEADLAAARGQRAEAELNVSGASDAASTALTRAQALAAALQASVTQWTEVTRIEALALETGAGVQRDLLRAQAGLFQARAGYAQARYDAMLARVRLARAAGILDSAWLDTALETNR